MFNFIDDDGIALGYDYDIWAGICVRIDCIPIFVEAGWPPIIEETSRGVYDVAADGISITEDRKTIVDSSVSTDTFTRLMVRADESRFDNRQQFADGDFRLGTQTGTQTTSWQPELLTRVALMHTPTCSLPSKPSVMAMWMP